MSWPDYLRLWEQFGFNGVTYMVPNSSMSALTALQAMRNPIVQAAIVLRAMAFSEITFAFQRRQPGKSGRDLFSAPSLDILDRPYAGASTGELLARMEFDVSLYGNSYWWVNGRGELTWVDPTHMHIVTGDETGPSGRPCGKNLLGYQVQDKSGQALETFLPHEIVHYRPIPDPDHPFRGLSWLSSLLPDITADQDMTTYKHSFLNNAATPNLVVKFSTNLSEDAFKKFKERFDSTHTGPSQGFKTMYVGAGADVQTVGSNFADLNLADNQAYGETRLSVAAGVPASLLGIAEGMKGATLNTANYAATRRRFSDITIRPLWRSACRALETICPPPNGARLWYDDREIAFLMADMQDQAAVRNADSTTIVNLTNAGYTPESVVNAVTENDWTELVHSGLTSVQLQPLPVGVQAAANGSGDTGSDTGGADDATD